MKVCECRICLSHDRFPCEFEHGSGGNVKFNCNVCGEYLVSSTLMAAKFAEGREDDIPPLKRALLSHIVRQKNDNNIDGEPYLLTTHTIDDLLSGTRTCPSPAQQATNIIRFIGDSYQKTGGVVESLPAEFPAVIGSPNRDMAFGLLLELKNRGLVDYFEVPDMNAPSMAQDVELKLDGWEIFEKERAGLSAGNYGFIAMKFGDQVLDPLIKDHVKPAIDKLGYQLVDLRDVAAAGVIDNLLRIQIRDAAFVLVDLTHENAGAYWEAGFAEGLSKPVLYLCEKKKFDEEKTHFDTNHCTTVPWSLDDVEGFVEELVATLRRSMNI